MEEGYCQSLTNHVTPKEMVQDILIPSQGEKLDDNQDRWKADGTRKCQIIPSYFATR